MPATPPRPPKGPEPRRPAPKTDPDTDAKTGAAQRRLSESDPGLERSATDSGRMGDKIGNFDPAAAPVQGDAEASGRPTSREAVERMVDERKRTAGRAAAGEPGFGRTQQPHPKDRRAAGGSRSMTMQISLAVIVALVLIGLLAAIMFS